MLCRCPTLMLLQGFEKKKLTACNLHMHAGYKCLVADDTKTNIPEMRPNNHTQRICTPM